MARKVENIIYDITARDRPLYPCWGSIFSTRINIDKKGESILKKDIEYEIIGMTNGPFRREGREKHWLVREKLGDPSDQFWIKEVDMQKIFDKGFMN